ncbi:MAG: hypothetical protein CVT95_12175, partial [Bacteroidetes bacterium HGW-Bacteroidetes-12]
SFNPDINWTSPTYIGIDQGVILTMIENYRTGFVQKLFMQNEYTNNAMQKAGFTEINIAPLTIKQEENKMTAAYYSYVHEPCRHTCNGNKGCYDECVKHTKVDYSVCKYISCE